MALNRVRLVHRGVVMVLPDHGAHAGPRRIRGHLDGVPVPRDEAARIGMHVDVDGPLQATRLDPRQLAEPPVQDQPPGRSPHGQSPVLSRHQVGQDLADGRCVKIIRLDEILGVRQDRVYVAVELVALVPVFMFR